jgi:hypothetical protein
MYIGKLQVLTSLVHDGEHSLEKMQRGSVKGGRPETGISGPMSLFENDDGMYVLNMIYLCRCVCGYGYMYMDMDVDIYIYIYGYGCGYMCIYGYGDLDI